MEPVDIDYVGASPAVSFQDQSLSRQSPQIGSNSSLPLSQHARLRYFHSRRVRKEHCTPLPIRKKSPKEKLLWIMPLCGVLLGLVSTGAICYYQLSTRTVHQYCPVLDEDFSNGKLNEAVWTKEVEVGGFGNQQFEQTTGGNENAFIKDGQLHIQPTLQDEALIDQNTTVNLLEDGTCTSNTWSNCVMSTNTTNGTIIQPVKSARLNTKRGAAIKYGRVEVTAKLPKGDWLWPGIWMMPVRDEYGLWPASGEIDIMESRGNNYTYSLGGNNFVSSTIHWGPNSKNDAYKHSGNYKPALHSQFGDKFHTYGLEWSEKYLFTYIDNRLHQVMYWKFDGPMWPRGNFELTDNVNGTTLIDPWSYTGRSQTPFDQEFYLILDVAVGGQNSWFLDGANGKPWVDASPTARKEFWDARNQWYPTWKNSGQMIIDRVQMWQQC